MSEECVKTVDIDNENIFLNPFDSIEPIEDSMIMYEKYLSCPANRNILERIGNNKIVSKEYESFSTTRKETLQRLACKYKLRSKLTIVRRDLVLNTFGVLVNQVNCEGEMGGSITTSIKRIYKEVETTYNNLRVKFPGGIQLIKVVDGKYPLWICNLFSKKNTEDAPVYLKPYDFLKRGFSKLRVQMHKNHIEDLPVYIPYNMGEFQGWDWKEYEPIITKYLPSAVICVK